MKRTLFALLACVAAKASASYDSRSAAWNYFDGCCYTFTDGADNYLSMHVLIIVSSPGATTGSNKFGPIPASTTTWERETVFRFAGCPATAWPTSASEGSSSNAVLFEGGTEETCYFPDSLSSFDYDYFSQDFDHVGWLATSSVLESVVWQTADDLRQEHVARIALGLSQGICCVSSYTNDTKTAWDDGTLSQQLSASAIGYNCETGFRYAYSAGDCNSGVLTSFADSTCDASSGYNQEGCANLTVTNTDKCTAINENDGSFVYVSAPPTVPCDNEPRVWNGWYSYSRYEDLFFCGATGSGACTTYTWIQSKTEQTTIVPATTAPQPKSTQPMACTCNDNDCQALADKFGLVSMDAVDKTFQCQCAQCQASNDGTKDESRKTTTTTTAAPECSWWVC